MTYARVLHEVQALEDRLQVVKWILTWPSQRTKSPRPLKHSAVARTAGLLGSRVPQGIAYERRTRQRWTARHKHVGEDLAKFLIDTNILIDHLRGDPKATAFLRDVEAGRVQDTVSVITETELLAYPALTRRQVREIEALLALLPTLAVTSRVARLAARYIRAHRIDVPDALIAATARLAGATLLTRNLKHFRIVRELHLQSL